VSGSAACVPSFFPACFPNFPFAHGSSVALPLPPPTSRYDRNKHIFPASRWEIYDPRVQRGSYTIHGGEVQTKKQK